MLKYLSAIAGVFLLVATAGQLGAQTPEVSDAAALVKEVDRLARPLLWPGFDPRRTPIAIYDGSQTLLFRHPSPPSGFVSVAAALGVVRYSGRYPEVSANSSAAIGGVTTATLMPAAAGDTRTGRAGIAIHEAFHVFQRQRHPTWSANEADLFTYPTGDTALLSARRREYLLLRKALLARDRGSSACDAFVALVERRGRFARLGEAGADYERKSELNEGLATYVEKKAIGSSNDAAVPDVSLAPDAIRAHAYRSGTALARLLDRFAPAWRDSLEAGDARSLDELLSAALARTNTERPNCGLDNATRQDIDRAAAHDVAGLTASLQAERDRFLAVPGWQVVIDASRAVLIPSGFDPLNVKLVTAGEVLHTRFVKLGNDGGTLEVLGRGALSESAGAHPLFNGVRVVTITGLDSEPVVTGADGLIKLVASGVSAEFKHATMQREGKVIRIVLGGSP